MRRNIFYSFLLTLAAIVCSAAPGVSAQTKSAENVNSAALRVGIVGLVHGHVGGFLQQNQRRTDIQIVGIAEEDSKLAAFYESKFALAHNIFFANADEMLEKAKPQAVLVYTNTYDHRSVVEAAARHGVPVMMEKPLAVSIEDARAIEAAAQRGKIQVLVNYETTWYRSNRAAYDLVHEKAIGDLRKVVVHDGHSGPKEIGRAS